MVPLKEIDLFIHPVSEDKCVFRETDLFVHPVCEDDCVFRETQVDTSLALLCTRP